MEKHRCLQHKNADVFMICVAADRQASFEHIDNWASEVRSVEPNKPICLIYTKKDLKDKEVEPEAVQ